jgi:hypothetical protein
MLFVRVFVFPLRCRAGAARGPSLAGGLQVNVWHVLTQEASCSRILTAINFGDISFTLDLGRFKDHTFPVWWTAQTSRTPAIFLQSSIVCYFLRTSPL